MYARAGWAINSLLVLLFSVAVAGAQGQGRPAFAQQELDQMVAPIALYPDALLSQILMAATYPGEVVEAAQWSRRNPDLNGDRAVRAVERIDWDPSVKSLVAFPQILDMMDQKLNWTEDLGDAFLDQQAQVMDTVQYLRRQAYSAGNLSSNDQFRVDFQDSSFTIGFANPEMVYLPYYNPVVIYGTWWWPAYQPVYWAPWPGYYARPGYARGYAWGPAIPVSRGFFFGAPDWHRRTVNIVNVNNYYYRPANVNRQVEVTRNANVVAGAPAVWHHDTAHRRDVPDRAEARQPPAAFGRGAPAYAPAQSASRTVPNQSPAATAVQGTPRGEPVRGAAARGQDSRGFDGRGESAHRSEPRVDAGNRPSARGNYQMIVGGMGASPVVERTPAAAVAPPVASPPAARSMPVPTQVQAGTRHPNVEQRPNVAAAREHAGHAATAPADNTVAAAVAPAPQAAGNARGNGGNSRHLQ